MNAVEVPGATEFATADGRRLFGQRLGTGTPTVIFEAGMGASRSTWGAVVERLVGHTEVAVYDRSGLGRSAPTVGPRTLPHLAADLGDVIERVAGDGPVVLVGHSWGGPIVRVAASQRPGQVVGVMLVDPTDEGSEVFFSKGNARTAWVMRKTLETMTRLGLVRRMVARLAADLPEPWATAMRQEDGTPANVAPQLAELETYVADLAALRDDPLPAPTYPLTVISGIRASKLERGRREELLTAHRARAATCAAGRWVAAEQSSHYVPFTEPELIATEILRLVDAHRSSTSPTSDTSSDTTSDTISDTTSDTSSDDAPSS